MVVVGRRGGVRLERWGSRSGGTNGRALKLAA